MRPSKEEESTFLTNFTWSEGFLRIDPWLCGWEAHDEGSISFFPLAVTRPWYNL